MQTSNKTSNEYIQGLKSQNAKRKLKTTYQVVTTSSSWPGKEGRVVRKKSLWLGTNHHRIVINLI